MNKNINMEMDINELIKENEGLVYYTINRFFLQTVQEYNIKEDLAQVGMMALYKAIQTYEVGRTEFSTYAVRVIKSKMINFLQNDLYKYISKGGEKAMHNNEGLDEDSEKMRDRTVGRFDDDTEVNANELLDYIKDYKDERAYKIVCLLSEGYTYEEIGDMLDLSKQRINQIITKLRKHLIDNKDKLHLGDYDINNNETNKIDNKPIIAYNEDEGIEFEYDNYIIACEELKCDKYYVKRSLLNKKTNIYSTSKVLNVKIYFKFK